MIPVLITADDALRDIVTAATDSLGGVTVLDTVPAEDPDWYGPVLVLVGDDKAAGVASQVTSRQRDGVIHLVWSTDDLTVWERTSDLAAEMSLVLPQAVDVLTELVRRSLPREISLVPPDDGQVAATSTEVVVIFGARFGVGYLGPNADAGSAPSTRAPAAFLYPLDTIPGEGDEEIAAKPGTRLLIDGSEYVIRRTSPYDAEYVLDLLPAAAVTS